jgi:hypothetical protein
MAKKRLTALQRFRKATIKQHLRNRTKTISDKKRAAKKAADRDLIEQWRALKKLGIYQTKENPTYTGLSKTRRSEIKHKFSALQSLGQYSEGEVYRPLHRHEYTRTIQTKDERGIVQHTRKQKFSRYELDRDHFQLINQKPKKLPGNALPTARGFITSKSPNERVRVNKQGKVETVETIGGAKTQFTREPLSGPADFITLIDDIKTGRLKFKDREGLRLWSNGVPRPPVYGQNAVLQFIKRLERYVQAGGLIRKGGGPGSFDDWSSNSEIAFVRLR